MKHPHEGRGLAEMSEKDLILKAKSGDAMAFEKLVHRYDRQVFSMAAHYVSNAEDAKDIYQEVFLRVYRALPKFEFRSEFSTWLFRITTNVCLTHRTRRRKHQYTSLGAGEGDDDDVSHRPAPVPREDRQADEKVLRGELGESIDRALNELSAKERLVFTMRHFEGLKLREIAELMNVVEGTVKKYLFTATQKVRNQLKEYLN
ncbi:MAG: sigma-70 family RNA polymerase sigma factor [Proteobacteria bacterium]|nr:sigma-70 family RNA polymerase sigma factor [Pseudomonadota bacterium]